MADTGYSGNMAASIEGVDLEIDELIKAVVERSSRRNDALSKRLEGAGPQLLRSADGEGETLDIRSEDEINSLMDDIRRDAEERAAQKTAAEELADIADNPEPDPQPWLADAVIAQQTMQSHEYRSQEARFDTSERPAEKRGFGINPFAKAAAAATAVAGTVALGRDEGDPTEEVGAEPEIAGDAFARNLVADDAEAMPVRDDQALDAQAMTEPEIEIAEVAADWGGDEVEILAEQDEYEAALLAVEIEDDFEETMESTDLAAMPIAAMQAETYGEDDGSGGMPVWLAMGIPVAAVSMAALVAGVHVVREAGAEAVPIEAASLAPMTITYAEAIEPPAIESAERVVPTAPITMASAPSVVPEVRVEPEPIIDASAPERFAETAPVLPSLDEPVEAIDVSAPVPRRVVEAERALSASVQIPSTPSAKSALPNSPSPRALASAPTPSWSAPERARLSNVPSLKPRNASLQRKLRTAAAPAVFRPQTGSVPVRVFDGRFERGSAALVVNNVAANMGGALNRTQQSWLARDMERALDNELDGRNVSLKSDRGDRIAVLFGDSAQELRRMPVARERSVAALPDQMVLEGGWYAARRDAPLRPTPSVSGTFSNRTVTKDALIERMATVTDRYGDRWYLMGQRGVAVGYMSPADLALAGALERPLGLPFERQLGETVQDMVPVFTRCRTVYVGPLGGTREKMDVCRNAKGNWVGAREGYVDLQQAAAPRPEPIVLASAVGQNPELQPFEEAPVRKSLTPKLVYGRAGQEIKQELSDGRKVEMTLGAKFETTRIVPVMRLEALGRIDRPVRLDARWMRAPGGARLRATPDYQTEVSGAALPPGSAIETIGTVSDDRGEDWVLVGRKGVGFGYVQRHELMPLAGSTALQAVPSQHTAATVDLVESVTECRTVDYLGAGLDGTFTACQQPDGQWALTAEPALRQLVDLEPSSQIAP